jgi:uncharacterized protein YndB with AHSA1/START domain
MSSMSMSTTIELTAETAADTDWPAELSPADCPIALRTERLIDAPPERVWSWLVRTDVWPDWFQGARAVRSTSGRELAVDARVRWWMMGAPAHATIRRLRPNELLAWEGGGPGARAYHEWRLKRVGDKTRVMTRVISSETARGPLATVLPSLLRAILRRSHDQCLAGLARVCASPPPPVWSAASPETAANPFAAHHLRYFGRTLAAHRDGRNRLVHLVATVVGFSCILSMLARIPLGVDVGALLALFTLLYFLPFEPLAAAIVGLSALASRLILGPRFGQVGVGTLAGIGVPLGIFLAFNLFGVWTHHLFDDPILAPRSHERLLVRLLKTGHTILFSSVHFVSFGLFALGWRPALRARVVAAAGAEAERMGIAS